jgi:hypothetical protein
MVLAQKERDRFIVVCPETDTVSSKNLAERIRSVAAEQMGLQVACGVASFPDDALTFRELVRQADSSVKTLLHDRLPEPELPAVSEGGSPELGNASASSTAPELPAQLGKA